MRTLILGTALAVAVTTSPAAAQAPFIDFSGSSMLGNDAAQTFDFAWSKPITGGTYSFATYTYSFTLTGGQSGATLTAGAPLFEGIARFDAVSTNLGFAETFAPCVAAAGETVSCASGSASVSFGPGFFNGMTARTRYGQDGLGSQVSFSGRLELFETAPTVVPEPGTFVLLSAGLAALVVTAQGRRRRG